MRLDIVFYDKFFSDGRIAIGRFAISYLENVCEMFSPSGKGSSSHAADALPPRIHTRRGS